MPEHALCPSSVHGFGCYNVTMNDVTPAQVVIKKPTPVLDRLGATGSLLCAIHCALLPLEVALVVDGVEP